MKKIMITALCIVYGNSMRAADVQVFQPDAMTVNVVNKNKPTIVNQNNPTIHIDKNDPFKASSVAELKFRMLCLPREQLQEKLATIDTHQLKLFLNTLYAFESRNLLRLLGEQGQSYIIKKRGSSYFLTIIEENIAQEKAQDKKREEQKLADEEWRKKGKVGFVGIFVALMGAVVGGTIYG